jgi:hypothetical protein
MYHYKIKKAKKRIRKRVIIWIISLFILAVIIYILISSHILQGLFEKKMDRIDEEGAGIICRQNFGGCFYFNKDGIIFKDAPMTSGSLIIIIQDYSNRNYELGNQILEKSFIDIILEINKNLFSEIGLKILSFSINSYPIEELKAITNEGWYVLFSLKRDIKNQLLVLKVGLNEKIKDRTNLQYVDLRIENRIYYK